MEDSRERRPTERQLRCPSPRYRRKPARGFASALPFATLGEESPRLIPYQKGNPSSPRRLSPQDIPQGAFERLSPARRFGSQHRDFRIRRIVPSKCQPYR